MRILIALILFFYTALAFAADTTVDSGLGAPADQNKGIWGPYYVDENTAIVISQDTGSDAQWWKTTSGGSSWGTINEVVAGTVEQVACMFDGEVPGDTGDLVHCVVNDSSGPDSVEYFQIDISASTTGGYVQVFDGGATTLSGSSIDNRIGLTKTVSGNLVMVTMTGSENMAAKSTDGGSTWSSIASFFDDTTSLDHVKCFPAATSDDNDAACIFWDVSASTIDIRMYDDSANSWTETNIASSMTNASDYDNFDGAVRHSDGHIIACAHNSFDTSTDDLQCWDVNPSTISSVSFSALTNVFDNTGEAGQVAVAINQQNDDIYVAWFEGGTYQASNDVYQTSSTNGGSTWATATQYSEDTGDDLRLLYGPRSIGNSGGIIQWYWMNDDTSTAYINLTNDTVISAVTGGATRRVIPVM